ncbi:MAG: hypothetical protein JNK05_12245 [Myxococcales bacterium]|nr:hypothetical protein [Myxococcales bacterium]
MSTRLPPAPELTLTVAELAEWYANDAVTSLRSLAITGEADADELGSLVRFLDARHLPALSSLELVLDAPLPERVWKTIAEHRAIEHLTLVGRCGSDLALRALSDADPALELRSLRVMFGRISEAGITALSRAPCVEHLELLWLWASGLGPLALSRLCAGAWPSLRELDLSYRHVPEAVAEIEQRFASLDVLNNAVADPTAPTRTQEALERQLDEVLTTGRPVASRAMLSLVTDLDDELFSARYLERCERATKRSRDEIDVFEVPLGRPQARVCSSMLLMLPAYRERLAKLSRAFDARHVGVYCDEASDLESVDWARLFPSIESLRLGACPRAWRALARVVPPVLELDLSANAWRWLDEGDDLHRLTEFLRAQPTIRRVFLGSGWWTDLAYRAEVEWALGAARIVDGWLERR